MNATNRRKGFTIVELVIVIAVIAILATVLVPTFSGVVQRAQNAATLQEASVIYTNYVMANIDSETCLEDLVIKLSDNEFVVIQNGAAVDTVYETADAAAALVKFSEKDHTNTSYDYYWQIDVSSGDTTTAKKLRVTTN